MLRIGSWRLLAMGLLVLAACGPRRIFVDAAVVDVPADDVADVATDVQDSASDVPIDSMDAGMCMDDTCDQSCVSMGCAAGVCRDNACSCRVCPDVPVVDAADAHRESSVRTCMMNSDCPPTEFCSGPMCTGVGFCFPRGEVDAATCAPDPHASCGCDGVAYPSVCARLSAGVRPNAGGCGSDAAVDAVSMDVAPDVPDDVMSEGG
jgi:hypothetical protein